MIKKNLIILIGVLIYFMSFSNTFAAQEVPTLTMSYNDYRTNAKNQCDDSKAPWFANSGIVSIPQYAKLTSDAINANINTISSDKRWSEDEKSRLKEELNMQRIGDFEGFKALEVARLQYRANLDNLFSCSIVESRLHIINDIQNKINAVFPSTQSEIQQQFKKIASQLQIHKNRMQCNAQWTDKSTFMKQTINSATRQYCHYRHYLSYLESNLKNNRNFIESIEKKVGTWSGTKTPLTTLEWTASYNNYANSLEKEINRAETSLPRAMQTYKDMEKAYSIHLLLGIIYDDYIRLRKNLASYMNASTQLYWKAFNAQSEN